MLTLKRIQSINHVRVWLLISCREWAGLQYVLLTPMYRLFPQKKSKANVEAEAHSRHIFAHMFYPRQSFDVYIIPGAGGA